MRSLGSFETIQVTEASSFTLDQMASKNSGLLAVSQSGETKVSTSLTLCFAFSYVISFFHVSPYLILC